MKKLMARTSQALKQHPGNLVFIGLLIVLFGSVGVLLLANGRAATASASFETELGTLATTAGKVSDTSASGSTAVKFTAPNQSSNTTFTIAVLPDVQRDLWNTTSINNNFRGRFNYLVQNKAALNLQYMIQVGDYQDTDNLLCAVGTPADQQSTCSKDLNVNPRYMSGAIFTMDHAQYYYASEALKIIENANIPFSLAVGNHDTGAVCGGPACKVVAGQTQSTTIEVRNTSTWNKYYTNARFHLPNTQGTNTSDTSGVYEANKTDNAYHTITMGGVKWLIMNYELWPRTGVVDWMKAIVASHPTYNVILDTHSYLNGGGGIEGTNGGYGANSPQYVYDNFVKQYANIRFTFSGHVGNSDYRVDTGVNGNKIYNFMDTYHDTTNNWIRLMTFDTQNNTVSTKVYSPLTNQTRTEANANVNITNINWVR